MNIELLKGQFKVDETSSFDSTDPRLDEIATLAQTGEYIEAARLSEVILASGIYDIRLICYFLYGYLLEEGLVKLIEVVECLNNIIVKNWDALGPINKREKVFEKSLEWMFKQLLKKIQYEEGKNTPLWQEWKADINSDQINEILELGSVLRLSLNHQLEDNAGFLVDLWSKLEKWLRVFQQLECHSSLPEPETETLLVLSLEETVPAEVINAPVRDLTNTGLVLENSYHMDLLLKKLAAFERLLEEQKFPKAALVAEDINETLSNFDAKLYFPKVFETFIRLHALNFEELATYTYQRDEQHWQIMQDWLKVDIDSFIKS